MSRWPCKDYLKGTCINSFCESGTLQNACSTRPRVGRVLWCASPGWRTGWQKVQKRMVTRVQWLCRRRLSITTEQGDLFMNAYSSNSRQLGCVFQDMEPPKSSSIYIRKPIRCVKFTNVVVRHADIRDQNPSLGMICPGEPHQRNSNAPKFEDRSQEETEWQEQCPCEAAWRLAKNILWSSVEAGQKYPGIGGEKIKQHSSHFQKIGACLHQILNLRNENLLSPPERQCTWSAKRTWILLKWILWRSRVVLR